MKILVVLLLNIILSHAYKVLPKKSLEQLSILSDRSRLKTDGAYLQPFLVPRVSGTEQNVKVREFIMSHFQALNWYIDLDNFTDTTPFGEKPFTNVIVTKNINARSRIVLAAHYDSKYFANFEFIGATDSAVSCAILLDIATSLDPFLNDNKDVTLQMIFFDGEEAFKEWSNTDSIYGARHLANKWSKTPLSPNSLNVTKGSTVLDTIQVFVLLDLLGTSKPRIINYFQSTSWLFHKLSDLERRVALYSLWEEDLNNMEEQIIFDLSVEAGTFGGIGDDYVPFLRHGVDVLHIIPWPFPSVWHKEEDNADAIDPNMVVNFNTLFRSFVAEYLEIDPLNHTELDRS